MNILRILLSICILLPLNALAVNKTFVDGTLSITMQAAPVGGLSTPRVMVFRNFARGFHRSLNWEITGAWLFQKAIIGYFHYRFRLVVFFIWLIQ